MGLFDQVFDKADDAISDTIEDGVKAVADVAQAVIDSVIPILSEIEAGNATQEQINEDFNVESGSGSTPDQGIKSEGESASMQELGDDLTRSEEVNLETALGIPGAVLEVPWAEESSWCGTQNANEFAEGQIGEFLSNWDCSI